MKMENTEAPCKVESTDVLACGGLFRSSVEAFVMKVERRKQRV